MIDKTKKYRTRDGREAEVYRTDGGGIKDVIGAIRGDNGKWFPQSWTSDGRVSRWGASPYDLIEVRPRIQGWVNVYRTQDGHLLTGHARVYPTRDAADRDATEYRIACIHIDVEEGEGL